MDIKNIIEASLFAASEPLSIMELQNLFSLEDRPDKHSLREVVNQLQDEYSTKPVELVEVANGYRFQVKSKYSPWVARLWEEKPVKYSRALLETLAIIAYQQPATRGEIEDIRGVAVGTNIIRTLEDRNWVRVIGRKEVPGRPALYATTKAFLDYFNLQTLADLPPLATLLEADLLSSNELQLNLGDDTPINKDITQDEKQQPT
ncbi:MAG: segregation and condensation protein B [Cycloclasticus pugetii]|jgi:segregation and condensation protein B|uniref:SMC-Scp complex subunit ScpB n=2 Tax=Cycloclasticus TaxID=34067 RepID=S5TYB5_9GAMM|nr:MULTISPECIES: SMC-Scp complex subunit ScpB [Cycloclasticus]AFT66782.1 condensin subunit ScpB [Cycloclasticus sp. P1]AGS40165.1 SMC-Scp complex subunit ScpB [Cycloclasticus zancles 78-ME]ATI03588.1 SMC-Scp complex subunit ScpB [Cycloclasticus sp. PY97N]EPD14075.1 condensin subunit ScpB [Cycloclasticus pugetii]MBV1898287.1 SMC-Scp complex subunit ScpB [Cycloclasticus sp.]|tara:strand:+ start:1910 stop:2521 length:612 start_codon:yes stop_codon:yes gene_type:complete